eukprot:comp17617_c0_seq1/m.17303 comp17617_c0_seq1/g.17303  ORF comp17617_c0_seq1/g.17303 comp17617_c0_seq1/m.17303 type:complete len:140 (-) comp17617_c0_seq1:45-464(-)
MALQALTLKLNPAAVCLFWAGTSTAIDVEATVKFTAPTLTREVGLDVGRHVFAAQLKLESGLAVVTLATAYAHRNALSDRTVAALVSALVLHGLQRFFFLPRLAKRAELAINKEKVPESKLHAYYIGVEVAKVLALLFV